jgi:formylglycine-generating enzyme required for sulfatase activity
MGWHMDNSGEQPQPVAQKKPNAWGLYDMHGNAAEWCGDWYARDYPAAGAADPNGPASGKARVARGGSFGHFARAARSAARASINPAYGLRRVGLRVVMNDPNHP